MIRPQGWSRGSLQERRSRSASVGRWWADSRYSIVSTCRRLVIACDARRGLNARWEMARVCSGKYFSCGGTSQAEFDVAGQSLFGDTLDEAESRPYETRQPRKQLGLVASRGQTRRCSRTSLFPLRGLFRIISNKAQGTASCEFGAAESFDDGRPLKCKGLRFSAPQPRCNPWMFESLESHKISAQFQRLCLLIGSSKGPADIRFPAEWKSTSARLAVSDHPDAGSAVNGRQSWGVSQ